MHLEWHKVLFYWLCRVSLVSNRLYTCPSFCDSAASFEASSRRWISIIYQLGNEIPAIYPATDLFLAPFLAEFSFRIDETLHQAQGGILEGHDKADMVFMTTFCAVTSFSLLLSGFLCILAARYKLANLGSFLPYRYVFCNAAFVQVYFVPTSHNIALFGLYLLNGVVLYVDSSRPLVYYCGIWALVSTFMSWFQVTGLW